MDIKVQLLTIFLSIISGFVYGYIIKKINNKYKLLVSIIMAFICFGILYLFNYGQLHYYYLIFFILSYLISSK